MFKLLVHAGCLCKVNVAKLKSEEKEFTLDALEYKTTADHAYLKTVQHNTIYIFHSRSGEYSTSYRTL